MARPRGGLSASAGRGEALLERGQLVAQLLEARPDGSVLCLENGRKGQELTTYQVMSTAG